MDAKGKEKGILKMDSRPRVSIDTKCELTPQQGWDLPPSSPQPSVDRLSVTWADPEPNSMSSPGVFRTPSESHEHEVKFSPVADGSEDEDYSASLSAVLRQRRASVRRSRKGRSRRPSSPFLPDDNRSRRRSSVFTTSSGDTAISMEEGMPMAVTQEQIFENIHLHKEVLSSVKQQPLGMRRKRKLVHQAKTYIKRHEGQLQERLAQSKSTRDIYARFNILLNTKWQQMKREAANTSNLLIPWELRIKEIESHFGSVVASYFTFLRWLFWVNLVIGFILLVFVIVPEYLTANPLQDGERKVIMKDERRNATNLLTLWEFEGVLKFSPIFYGYYSNVDRPEYRMPLAYFLTGLAVYIYSFVAILRKMAENSRMSKLSEKEDECIFSWKLFTGWDFMIGNTETAHNRIASIILGFKEALLEEAEKKKDLRNWRIISLRALVNICVIILLAVSAFAVVTVVYRSDDNTKPRSWWRENETTVVVTVISITFPVFFELLGFLEHYHPRKQLRLQLARIMLLNLLNLYSLIFALFSKIEGMSNELDTLKPTLSMNATVPDTALNISESIALNQPLFCVEVSIPCSACNFPLTIATAVETRKIVNPLVSTTKATPKTTTVPSIGKVATSSSSSTTSTSTNIPVAMTDTRNITEKPEIVTSVESLLPLNLIESISIDRQQLDLLRELNKNINDSEESSSEENSSEESDDEYTFYDDESEDSTTVKYTSYNAEISSTDYNNYNHTVDLFSTTTESFTYPFNDSSDEEISTTDIFELVNVSASESTYTLVSDSYGIYNITDASTTDHEYYTDNNTFSDVSSTSQNSFATFKFDENTETESSTIETEPQYSTTGIYSDSTYVTSNFTDVEVSTLISTTAFLEPVIICPNISFNCTVNCGGINITQVFLMTNCSVVEKKCYKMQCHYAKLETNVSQVDMVYEDEHKRKMYNLTITTKKKLLKLCWETMFGQELVKLTMMDLVFVLLGTLFMDFFRALFVRYMNRCWCWDLEKKFPEYGDFKIAENILHLINNQGMVWMGMFFSPGLVILNVSKLMIMMYLRSWAVMTCNVPHEVVFRVSKSNNFYLALLLTMLFLCVLPVGYTIVWVKPSWHCGPFSEYEKIYHILTTNILWILPDSLNFTLEYIASPAIVIPLLVLLVLIIYYLTSLTNSLREANNDLKIQLRRERTEERRKMFQLADTRRRGGSSAMDNTPFARWKKALPSFPISKSIDSDDRKTITGEDGSEPSKVAKKKGSIFAKIVGIALDKKTDVTVSPVTEDDVPPSPNNENDEVDTDFHENLPKEVLKFKNITIVKQLADLKRKPNVDFKPIVNEESNLREDLKIKMEKTDGNDGVNVKPKEKETVTKKTPSMKEILSADKKLNKKQASESSNQSKQSDSIGSIIPVITISTTESDDETLNSKKEKKRSKNVKREDENSSNQGVSDGNRRPKNGNSEAKSLRRQSSVDSTNDQKMSKEKKEDGHKYQYSL